MIESYPLYWPEGWKRTESWRRERSRFKTGFGAARELVFGEIRRMGGTKQILSTNVPLRNDGLPRANTPATNGETGVAVYFTYRKKDMVFACDKYTSVADNIYAIAKTIEALRGIERWGASDMLERAFRGFAALPEKASSPWRETLGFGPEAAIDSDVLDTRFRELVQQHHPDRGGDPEKFQSVIEARSQARKELLLPEVCR